MVDLILNAFYFILPAYIANMMPVFGKNLRLPGGQAISTKLLGSHKTWRGFYLGYCGALLVLYLQSLGQNLEVFQKISLLEYQELNLWLYAFFFGIGALFGDACKSFFKRRLKIKSGQPWFPFDQLDFIFGALLFLWPFYQPGWQVIVTLIILTPLLHFLTNFTAYKLGLKEVWW